MTTRIKALLQYARALIAEPGTWTKGHFALDAFGLEVDVDSPEAVCFCSQGALRRAFAAFGATNEEMSMAYHLLTSLSSRLAVTHAGRFADPINRMLRTISGYNDNHTREEVLALWDKAIQESTEAVWT